MRVRPVALRVVERAAPPAPAPAPAAAPAAQAAAAAAKADVAARQRVQLPQSPEGARVLEGLRGQPLALAGRVAAVPGAAPAAVPVLTHDPGVALPGAHHPGGRRGRPRRQPGVAGHPSRGRGCAVPVRVPPLRRAVQAPRPPGQRPRLALRRRKAHDARGTVLAPAAHEPRQAQGHGDHLRAAVRFRYGGDGRAADQRANTGSRVAFRTLRRVHHGAGSCAHLRAHDQHVPVA